MLSSLLRCHSVQVIDIVLVNKGRIRRIVKGDEICLHGEFGLFSRAEKKGKIQFCVIPFCDVCWCEQSRGSRKRKYFPEK